MRRHRDQDVGLDDQRAVRIGHLKPGDLVAERIVMAVNGRGRLDGDGGELHLLSPVASRAEPHLVDAVVRLAGVPHLSSVLDAQLEHAVFPPFLSPGSKRSS